MAAVNKPGRCEASGNPGGTAGVLLSSLKFFRDGGFFIARRAFVIYCFFDLYYNEPI